MASLVIKEHVWWEWMDGALLLLIKVALKNQTLKAPKFKTYFLMTAKFCSFSFYNEFFHSFVCEVALNGN